MPASNFYLDTNVLLAACLAEPESLRVRRWLDDVTGGLATSDWALTEFVSALGIKVRRGELAAAQARFDHPIDHRPPRAGRQPERRAAAVIERPVAGLILIDPR